MKRFSLTKRLLVLALALFYCMGLFVVTQGAEKEFGTATSLQTGEYILVVSGITPTGMSNGDYYISDKEANNPGLLFNAFNKNKPDGATYWKVTRVSDSECTVQNTAKGENGYLNITANTLKYGSKTNLKYSFSGGKCKFYATVGGTNYYIRFTNSTNNESRFHAGTGDGSNQFSLYGMISPEAEPDYEISDMAGAPLPKEDPLLTVACITDLHADYGLQSKDPYIRNSVIKTLNQIKQENADILLIGGDNTSDNGKVANAGGWKYTTFQKVIASYKEVTEAATESGRTLWACGNHDHQAGEFEGYDAYADYETLMKDSCGEPLSVFRHKDEKSLSQQYPDHILGLHYKIENFDFIVLNAPYSQALTYSAGTLKWLDGRLRGIGSDKTVFLVTHYPMTDGRGISTPSYGLSGGNYNSMMNILKKYPNLIYLYGHNHGGAETVYISEDTFERINSYASDGRVINNRNAVPTSFISSFMGSMSYYKYSYNEDWLDARDPDVVQALMIYVYGDRIVFQMKNYGTALSNVTPKSWTVMRDVSASLTGNGGSSSDVPSDPSTDTTDPSTDSNGGTTPEIPDVMANLLVTTDVNSAVGYNKAESVTTFAFDPNAPVIKTMGSTSLAGAGLKSEWKVSTNRLESGDAYDALSSALGNVVYEFYAFEFKVREKGNPVNVEGMVKVTLSVPENFRLRADQITFGAYYLKDGALQMTDAVKSEDGKDLTFLLPELTPFALSARATVAADTTEAPGSTDNTGTDTEKLPETESLGIILAITGGVVVVAGLAVLAVVLMKMWKKDRATPYQE